MDSIAWKAEAQINANLKNKGEGRKLESSVSGMGSAKGRRAYGHESWGSVEGGEFHHRLIDCSLLMDTTPMN
jgi:hypothetical protein